MTTSKKNIDLGYLVLENKFYPGFYNYEDIEEYLLDVLLSAVEEHFVAQEFHQVEELVQADFCSTKSELINQFKKEGLGIELLGLKKARVGKLKINLNLQFEEICEVEVTETVITTVEKKEEIKER